MKLRGILHPNIRFLYGQKGGFTIIELLAVITILLILLAGSAVLFGRFFISGQLNTAREQVVYQMKTAKIRAQANVANSPHGVYFQTHGIVLFQGETYATRSSTHDIVTNFKNTITLQTSSFASEIIFSQGSGFPSVTGTLQLIHDNGDVRNLLINSYGVIEGQ